MALKFNGTTQYVDCGNGTSLQITGDVSVSAWLMAEENWVPRHSQYHNVAIKGSVFNLGYGLYVYERSDKTHPQFFVRNSSGQIVTGLDFYVPNNWGVNNWVHLVGTFSSSAGRIRLYEAGVMVAEVSTTLYPGSTSDRFYIARPADSYNTNDVFFMGYIADVRVYNRELTANEIAEIYHKRGADKVWHGLVGWWRLDELPSGTPAPLLLDAMDATTGWTNTLQGLISLNSVTYKEGSGALNLYKTATDGLYPFANKYLSTSYDLTSKDVWVWVYIKDTTTLNKLADVRYYLGTDNYYYNYHFTSLSVGWNALGKNVTNYDGTYGSPDISDINRIYIGAQTNNSFDTLAEGDLIFDFMRAEGNSSDDSIFQIPDLSGNGNHGIPSHLPVYQASPHRLRRGVLVS